MMNGHSASVSLKSAGTSVYFSASYSSYEAVTRLNIYRRGDRGVGSEGFSELQSHLS